jgi:quinol-cytochrome oxidoreductase complex cytochrome b subunit
VNDTLLTALQYYGAGAATLAALIVSLNLGRRRTGWAFVIFVTSSIALIAWGFLQPDSEGIGWQNIALLIINAIGVYRYLIRKDKPDDPGKKRGETKQ